MRLLLLALALAASAQAQPTRTLADDDWCDGVERWGHAATECEVRETVTRAGALDVRATNGSVTVKPWDRADVLVRARVVAGAPDPAGARRLLADTDVVVERGAVSAETPETGRDRWVAVSFEVFAPASTDLDVTAMNGPVQVLGLRGRLRADALNGPVSLRDVGGDVAVKATNGPVEVVLDGPSWSGRGLSVAATNGPITVNVPRGYSARLTARTVNGHVSADGLRLPARDRRWAGDEVEATLGDGGAPISLRAQNGPVRLRATG